MVSKIADFETVRDIREKLCYISGTGSSGSNRSRRQKRTMGSYFSLVIHLRAIAIAISKFSLSTDFEAPPPPPSSTKVSSPILIVKRAGSYAWTHKSWRVREEFARTVTLAIGLFASTELPLQRGILPHRPKGLKAMGSSMESDSE